MKHRSNQADYQVAILKKTFSTRKVIHFCRKLSSNGCLTLFALFFLVSFQASAGLCNRILTCADGSCEIGNLQDFNTRYEGVQQIFRTQDSSIILTVMTKANDLNESLFPYAMQIAQIKNAVNITYLFEPHDGLPINITVYPDIEQAIKLEEIRRLSKRSFGEFQNDLNLLFNFYARDIRKHFLFQEIITIFDEAARLNIRPLEFAKRVAKFAKSETVLFQLGELGYPVNTNKRPKEVYGPDMSTLIELEKLRLKAKVSFEEFDKISLKIAKDGNILYPGYLIFALEKLYP